MSLDQRFAEAMGALLGPEFPSDIGLAVSGGGDSMAMLTLAHNWSHAWGVRLWVVTVDHGLRAESADEAAMVAAECAALGWPHATLRWHWDGGGNVMDAARRGRLALIDRWRGGLRDVLMAHTRDDLAETFLLRLARGSGVDGLAAMAAAREVALPPGGDLAPEDHDGELPRSATGAGEAHEGYRVLRPCLDMSRAELRHYLRTLKGRWVEDPSNDDPAFDRVKVRQAKAALSALGLDDRTLVATARRMARARAALRAQARQAWDGIGQEGCSQGAATGALSFARDGFEALARDTQLRLLAAALQYVATAEYRPRETPLEALLDRLLAGGGGTLHGCEARMERDRLHIWREFKALEGVTAGVGDGRLWDGRWWIFRPEFKGLTVRALGEDGWRQLPAEHPDGAPAHASARSLPAIFDGATLVACDAMGVGPGATAALWPMGREANAFGRFLLSH